MPQFKNFLYYLCLIITLMSSPLTISQAMEEYSTGDEFGDEYSRFNTGTPTSGPSINRGGNQENVKVLLVPTDGTSTDLESEILNTLKTYYNPTILTLRVGKTAGQVLSGCAGVAASFPSFQVPVPLLLGAIRELGITPGELPTYIALIIAPPIPVVTGVLAAYGGAAKLLSYETSEYEKAHTTLTTRQQSLVENIVYSPFNKFFQFALYGILVGAMITNLESHIDQSTWGPYWIWAVTFTAFFLVPIYYMMVAKTNNPNKHPFRHYENEEAKQSQQTLLAILKAVKEEIMNGNFEQTKPLARKMNVLLTETSEERQEPLPEKHENSPLVKSQLLTTVSEKETHNTQEIPEDDDKQSQSDLSSANLTMSGMSSGNIALKSVTGLASRKANFNHEHAYLNVLQEMSHIYDTIPPLKKWWINAKETAALVCGTGMQIGGIPIKTLAVYGTSNILLSLFMPTNWALGTSAVVAGIFTPGILGGSYKEIPMTRDEFYDLFSLYPADSPPYWQNKWVSFIADRLPSAVSIAGAAYIVLPMWVYLRINILEAQIGIQNKTAQAFLITPWAATVYAGARQFVSGPISKLANWFSTGMEVDIDLSCCSSEWRLKGKMIRMLTCCFPSCCRPSYPTEELPHFQELLEKMKEIEEKTTALNKEASLAITQELKLLPSAVL